MMMKCPIRGRIGHFSVVPLVDVEVSGFEVGMICYGADMFRTVQHVSAQPKPLKPKT